MSAVTVLLQVDCKDSLRDAFQCIVQPHTALHDCMMSLNTYDPGTSPGSANHRILGDVYLRSNLSRRVVSR